MSLNECNEAGHFVGLFVFLFARVLNLLNCVYVKLFLRKEKLAHSHGISHHAFESYKR